MAARKKPGATAAAEVVPLRPARKCPICGKPAVRAYYPFDSKRCADIDLSKWLGGGYAIAAEPVTQSDPAEAGDDEDEPR